MKTLRLPDLGEGLTEAEIHEWHVKLGDTVQVDQRLVSVETAKAVVDIPSPYQGIVKQRWGEPGDTIKTGAPLIALQSDTLNPLDSSDVICHQSDTAKVTMPQPKHTDGSKCAPNKNKPIKAIPAARNLAKQLDIDLDSIQPAHPHGPITLADVKKAASLSQDNDEILSSMPLKGVRRSMAIALAQAHQNTVPATLTELVDVHHWPTHDDITLRLIQAMVSACQQEPALNAHFHHDTLSCTVYKIIHLGIAMDTPYGLYVPVLHNVASYQPADWKKQLDQFKALAVHSTFPPHSLKGATITLSNFGSIAGLHATPMVVPPTVAILGVGRLYESVVPYEGQPAIHSLLPLSLTIDHRAVTGGEAARFLKAFSTALTTQRSG